MIKYEINTDQLDEAKNYFGERHLERHLLNNRASGSFSASRLYRFVLGHKDEDITAALSQNLSLRRAYKTLLKQAAYFQIPQAIAASSQDYPDRHCDGCTLRLQASRAESSQLYLIIEVTDTRRDMPNVLTAFIDDEACIRLELPVARNGVIQTIIDVKSDMATLLANPKTEIYLR